MNIQILEIARLEKKLWKKKKESTDKHRTKMLESSCNECYKAETVL